MRQTGDEGVDVFGGRRHCIVDPTTRWSIDISGGGRRLAEDSWSISIANEVQILNANNGLVGASW